MENSDQKHKAQIYKYLSNEATAEEKKELLEWLQQSEENTKLFSDYKKLFDLTANANYNSKFNDRASEHINMLRQQINPSTNRNQSFSQKFQVLYKIAASVVIAFSAGALLSLWLLKNDSTQELSSSEYQIVVPKGGKSELELPDGTKVWLNAGSKFKYSAGYGINGRDVYLEGEGYFSVIKNPEKPFIVNASGLEIKAYGTSFNVKAYPEDKSVTTTLVEGIVKIEGNGVNHSMKPKEVVVLNKNLITPKADDKKALPSSTKKIELVSKTEQEDIVFDKSIEVKSDVDINVYTSWKDNYWMVDSESLENIALYLERKFDVTIQIDSPQLRNYTFTGTFHKETLEQILDILNHTAPMRYTIKEGIVVIKEEHNRKSIYDNLTN